MSARPDTTEHIVIEFDRPQTISRLLYEVEQTMQERTQEVRVDVHAATDHRTFYHVERGE